MASQATVNSATDYFPFGMVARTYASAEQYRYGFNGKEHEDDITGGDYDFGARIYDPRLGRWLATDPLVKKYPQFSSYSFVANCPLLLIDIDGREIYYVNDKGVVVLATAENLKGTKLEAGYKVLMSTKSGKALWNYYMNNTDKDIYLALGDSKAMGSAAGITVNSYDIKENTGPNGEKTYTGSGVEADGTFYIPGAELKVFDNVSVEKSANKSAALIVLNPRDFTGSLAPVEILDQAETIFHEIKAHVNLSDRFPKSPDDHDLYGSEYTVSMWGKGYTSKQTPAGNFVQEVLDANVLPLSTYATQDAKDGISGTTTAPAGGPTSQELINHE